MLRYKTKTRPGLVALYDIRPGNGAGPFLQPRSSHGAIWYKVAEYSIYNNSPLPEQNTNYNNNNNNFIHDWSKTVERKRKKQQTTSKQAFIGEI